MSIHPQQIEHNVGNSVESGQECEAVRGGLTCARLNQFAVTEGTAAPAMDTVAASGSKSGANVTAMELIKFKALWLDHAAAMANAGNGNGANQVQVWEALRDGMNRLDESERSREWDVQQLKVLKSNKLAAAIKLFRSKCSGGSGAGTLCDQLIRLRALAHKKGSRVPLIPSNACFSRVFKCRMASLYSIASSSAAAHATSTIMSSSESEEPKSSTANAASLYIYFIL